MKNFLFRWKYFIITKIWKYPKGQIIGEWSHHNAVIMFIVNDSYKDCDSESAHSIIMWKKLWCKILSIWLQWFFQIIDFI